MAPVWEAATAVERVRAYAAAVRRIMESAGDVFAVLAAAATTDPDVVGLAETTEQRRLAEAMVTQLLDDQQPSKPRRPQGETPNSS